jgi:hypothetical protein
MINQNEAKLQPRKSLQEGLARPTSTEEYLPLTTKTKSVGSFIKSLNSNYLIWLLNSFQRLTMRLIYCLMSCVFGSSFQIGWSSGVLNTSVSVVILWWFEMIFSISFVRSIKAFRTFYNSSFSQKNTDFLTEYEWELIWVDFLQFIYQLFFFQLKTSLRFD